MAYSEAELFTTQSIHKTILENVDALREQRAVLVSDIAKMNDEIITMSKKLEKIRKRHEQELQQMLSDKNVNHQNVLTLKQEVLRLKSAVDSLEPIKRHLDMSIADKQTQLARIESKLEESRSIATEYTQQIEQARTLWNDIIARATEETKNLENAKVLSAQLEPSKVEAQELASKIKKQKVEESELSTKILELKDEESELRAKIAALTFSFEQQRMDELNALKKQHEAELVIAKTRMEFESLSTKNNALVSENENIENQIMQKQNKKNEIDNEVSQALSKLKNCQLSITPLEELISARKAEAESINQEIEILRISLKDLAQKISEKDENIKNLDTENQRLLLDNKRIYSTIETLKSQENEWRYKVSMAQHELEATETEIVKSQKACIELTSDIESCKLLNEKCHAENQELQGSLMKVQQEYAKLQAARASLQQENDDECIKLQEVREQIAGASVESSLIIEKINSAKLEYETIIKTNEDLDNAITTKKETEASLEALISEKNQEISSLNNMAAELEAKTVLLEQQVIEGKKNAESYKSLEADLAATQIRLKEIQHKEEKLKNSISVSMKNEKGSTERVLLLEKKEVELLEQLEKSRNELRKTEMKVKETLDRITHAEQNLDRVNKSLAEATRKREIVIELLKKDTDAVKEAREHLREIEELQNTKLKEIDAIQQVTASIAPVLSSGQNNDTEIQNRPNSAQIRADAEKTLDTLRKHLDSVAPRNNPSKSCKGTS